MDHRTISSLTDDQLLSATRDLVRRSCSTEADLLLHLGEIDERKLHLDRAFSSMFTFCTRELGFSEGAAYNRIFVARAARKFPALISLKRIMRSCSRKRPAAPRTRSPNSSRPSRRVRRRRR